MLGVAASTCSYQDWLGTELLVFIGSDTPNNQPVTTKYMYYAKKQGTKIAVINPYREPGLERYWVPSVLESALFGTKLADAFFQIHVGGDVAFLNGVLKMLIERDWIDAKFIRDHCAGFEELKATLAGQSWEMLEKSSGASKQEMLRFAEMLVKAQSGIFVWSMGVTQHANGVENVKAIINLCLARGFIGRPQCGLMAIRGHSGVQGGAEVGCVPNQFPGGLPVNEENAKHFEKLWEFSVSNNKGLNAVEMIDAAHAGKIDVLYSAGGNFLETLPEPDFVREALERVPLRVHQDLVLSPPMLLDPADTVILLPAQTRYEQRGGGTETSTERMIYFLPKFQAGALVRRKRNGRFSWSWPSMFIRSAAGKFILMRPHKFALRFRMPCRFISAFNISKRREMLFSGAGCACAMGRFSRLLMAKRILPAWSRRNGGWRPANFILPRGAASNSIRWCWRLMIH
jgi:molybdopterin-dependent oxidoreductase alpha subunit